MSKHVCFVNSVFGREDALIVYRQGMSLVEAGYKVSYTVFDDKPNETKECIEIFSMGEGPDGSKGRFLQRPKILKAFIDQHPADVYQISEPELLPLGLKLKKEGKTVVYNLREWYPDYYARKFKQKWTQKLVVWAVERYFHKIAKKYDAVFNCMPEMREYIEKVMPCKYFEDTANFPIVHKDFSLNYEDYCKREPIISYFGSIYTISCQEEILQALESFPDVKYLLAGVFYEDRYKKQLEQMPAWKQVTFKNGFTREELPGIIDSSIMGNVVKDFDQTETPQGSYSIIKIFETMEAAVPVILAKVPLYEQMVEKYHCGICVRPHSVEDFKNAIEYLLTHKKEAYEMGLNGRRAVIEEFSWDSQAKGYLKVINALVNE